jgi:hypothetical protein
VSGSVFSGSFESFFRSWHFLQRGPQYRSGLRPVVRYLDDEFATVPSLGVVATSSARVLTVFFDGPWGSCVLNPLLGPSLRWLGWGPAPRAVPSVMGSRGS